MCRCCACSIEEVTRAIEDALQLGTIAFDAVKHLLLCRIERRPPRLDMETSPTFEAIRKMFQFFDFAQHHCVSAVHASVELSERWAGIANRAGSERHTIGACVWFGAWLPPLCCVYRSRICIAKLRRRALLRLLIPMRTGSVMRWSSGCWSSLRRGSWWGGMTAPGCRRSLRPT